jgi:hypothetical protein
MWHCVQAVTLPAGASWCEFVNGNPVLLWLKTPADHVVMGWQVEQAEAVVGKFAATWFGTFPPRVCVLFHEDRWQPMQSAEFSE